MLPRSFEDWDQYAADEGDVFADYPYARREMMKEIAFVGPVERQVFGHQHMFHYIERIVGHIDLFGPCNVHQAVSGRDSHPVVGP